MDPALNLITSQPPYETFFIIQIYKDFKRLSLSSYFREKEKFLEGWDKFNRFVYPTLGF